MFGFGAQQPTPTPDPDPTPDPGIPNIINQNLNQGGGGGGGIMGLQQTFTPGAQPRSIPAISDISAQNIATYLKDPALQAKYGSSVEYDKFMQSQMPQPNFIQRGITAAQDFFSGLSTPKVQGTLGTRLANQRNIIPLPGAMMAYARSPFNPDSKTFNPALEGQLNYLEGQDGYIGRDQQSGLLKYGPESVLSGQNVISGFGTNDYVKQLDKYINKMIERGTVDDEFAEANLSKFQLEKLKKARIEKQKFIDSAIYKTQQEEIRKQQEARRQAELQRKIAAEAAAGKSLSQIGREQFTGEGQAFERRSDTFSRGKVKDTGGVPGGKYGSPRKDGGLMYADGGRVYLYNRLK
jgi:hypothetical protein